MNREPATAALDFSNPEHVEIAEALDSIAGPWALHLAIESSTTGRHSAAVFEEELPKCAATLRELADVLLLPQWQQSLGAASGYSIAALSRVHGDLGELAIWAVARSNDGKQEATLSRLA